MKLLVLGGSGFLGYHVASEAVRAGHEVSTFTRGSEAPLLEVEPLKGDREGDLSALEGRTWDAVLDTFSKPEAVGDTVRLLSGNVGVYGYISGITNYHPEGPATVDEDSPLRRSEDDLDDPLQERGIAKLRCERAVTEEFGGPALIVRTGIMVGPRDPTDRFSWWPVRFARGGEILAPGEAGRKVQFTDARDLARWIVGMLADAKSGTFNTVGPGCGISLAGVLEACRRVAEEETGATAGETQVVWAEEQFLRERLSGVEEEERPLWFPEDQIPFDHVDSSKALAAGLEFRPVEETARDTLDWMRSRQDRELRAGFSPGFERELLESWRARSFDG